MWRNYVISVLIGLLLTVYGFVAPVASSAPFAKGGQINLWWGLVMLIFGLLMLLVARPPDRSDCHTEPPKSPNQAMQTCG